MKKLLIGLLSVGSLSIFANEVCNITIVSDSEINVTVNGNSYKLNDDLEIKDLSSESDYEILVTGQSGMKVFLDDLFNTKKIMVQTKDNNIYTCEV